MKSSPRRGKPQLSIGERRQWRSARWGQRDAFSHSGVRGGALGEALYAALGNHDHNGNIQAQVEYTALNSRWPMPSCYYAFSSVIEKGVSLEIFVLDTQPIRHKDRTSDSQLRWLEDKLERSTAHWKIVVGHHPFVQPIDSHAG